MKVIKEPSRHEKERKQYSNRKERERTFVRDEEAKYSGKRERERSRSAKREKERERERSRSARRGSRSRSGDRKKANVSTQVQPSARNVSVNCPSPILLSPPSRKKKQVNELVNVSATGLSSQMMLHNDIVLGRIFVGFFFFFFFWSRDNAKQHWIVFKKSYQWYVERENDHVLPVFFTCFVCLEQNDLSSHCCVCLLACLLACYHFSCDVLLTKDGH